MKTYCCFCSELAAGLMPSAFAEKLGASTRVVAETQLFAALPSISPLQVGHLLILPRCHVSSLAQLGPSDLDDLRRFVEGQVERLKLANNSYLFFEHGVAKGMDGGCGVDHAHLHIVPLKARVIAEVVARVTADYPSRGCSNFELIDRSINANESYLIFGKDLDVMAHSVSRDIPSQYMRKVIAAAAGLREWDWNKLFGWEEMGATLTMLQRGGAVRRASDLSSVPNNGRRA